MQIIFNDLPHIFSSVKDKQYDGNKTYTYKHSLNKIFESNKSEFDKYFYIYRKSFIDINYLYKHNTYGANGLEFNIPYILGKIKTYIDYNDMRQECFFVKWFDYTKIKLS